LDLTKFERGLPKLYHSLRRSRYPRNRRLSHLIGRIPGFATENKLMLLNFAASLLARQELYLEVGTWQGLSLIGAMWENADKEFFAIDNFSQFGNVRQEFHANLVRWLPHARLTFLEGDCFSLLRARQLFGGRKIGVYFYDGDHAYQSQFRGLQYVQKHLSDSALVVIDDTAYQRVRSATSVFMSFRRGYRLLFDLRSEYDGEPRWWNGIQVYSYDVRLRS